MPSVDYMSLVRLILALAGAALMGYGGWLAWEPLGFLLPGALLVAVAFVGEIRAGRIKSRGGNL